ncbi:MAG: UDP-2,4-diacetamido-2,4,6-trideoxy-beta-L-altropyranose hydrolase [Rhodobacteraceae bacterium]|nr:UDP-2,4-diacetamido-2,4,6-trideoxy-beta-L-altropyranose hydrolase [Paracoccaceae bacterium]
MRIVFRVDASFEIGSGHVMRCLTLAEACRHIGAEVLFISRRQSGNMADLIRGRGFKVCEFDMPERTPGHLEDAKQSAKAMETSIADVDWLIVDHYELSSDWEEYMRRYTRRIMVIDDLENRPHDCDLLLDQNYRQSYEGRYSECVNNSCDLFMGPKYALLQHEYAEERNTARPRAQVHNLLLYFGGSDNTGLTAKALHSALSLDMKRLRIEVVLPLNPSAIAAIQAIADGETQVTLHQGLPSLAPLIRMADLAIGALGATSWERLCLGLPTIGVTTASNQLEVAKELSLAGLATWLGDVEDVTENMISKSIVEASIRQDFADWSARCMEICDGLGAQRIVNALSRASGRPI